MIEKNMLLKSILDLFQTTAVLILIYELLLFGLISRNISLCLCVYMIKYLLLYK